MHHPKTGKRLDQGFTLIELLVVIVILGVLSAVVVFSVDGIIGRGRAEACQATAETLRIASEAYNANNEDYATSLQVLADNGYLNDSSGDFSSNTVILGGGSVVYNPDTGGVDDSGCGEVGGGGAVTVANFEGQDGDSATTALEGLGLTVNTVLASSPSVPAGNVISQDPAGPVSVPAGSTVTLTISTGPAAPVAPTGGSVSISCYFWDCFFDGELNDGEDIEATTSNWNGTVTSYSYQWQRRTDGNNNSCPSTGYSDYGSPVSSPNATVTYTTQSTQTDYCYRVVVTAYNGASASAPVTSNVLHAN